MKKSLLFKIGTILMMAFLVFTNVNQNLSLAAITDEGSKLKATQLGIGGGGALFQPEISPFDSNNMLVISDMGGIYITHNKGESWSRKNLFGTVYAATYDENNEGVVYAGGSGVYRSTDNGDTFDLIFPKKEDVIARLTQNENGIQYYFTHSKIYDKNKLVESILVNPENSDQIFVLCFWGKDGIVYESIDNGESFHELFRYNTVKNISVYNGINELFYKRETHELYVVNDEEVISYNLNSSTKTSVYKSSLGIVDADMVYENNKTYFILIEKTNDLNNSYTRVYYTNDFVNKTDFTSVLSATEPTSFNNNYYGLVTYKYNFRYVSATSLENIYVTNKSNAESSTLRPYPYIINGIIRYRGYEAEYLFGNPFKDHNTLKERLWADGNTHALGIYASSQNDDEFIFTTLCGVVYSPDGINLYPRYSKVTEGTYPNSKYTTSGIDEQTTYGVREDPFHENVMLLLNTDLGLIKSTDGGKSWKQSNKGIPGTWVNTVYDLEYDKRQENYVYSIWSGRHDAPYSAGNETDGRHGGFAISKDGGDSWDATYSSGIPENAIPVKMEVLYQENSSDVIIYVATFNHGFYVSYDSGKTFTEMNEGISPVSYKALENYQYILASDIEVSEGRIFGITAKSSYNSQVQPGELFEYVNDRWNKIDLPENTQAPRDIYYHDGALYVTGTAKAVWEYKNGTDFTNYGGGVYKWENGVFTQIFDESISTTSVQIDDRGTMYVSDINGNIYRKEKDKDYQKIYDSYHYISKWLELSSDGDYLYLASFGGGLLKLENLNSLYHHDCIGGHATCLKKAICEICGLEYGTLNPNNHETSSTHIINQKDPTYYEDGYTGDVVYDCCNAVKEKGSVIPKLHLEKDEPSEVLSEEEEMTDTVIENTKVSSTTVNQTPTSKTNRTKVTKRSDTTNNTVVNSTEENAADTENHDVDIKDNKTSTKNKENKKSEKVEHEIVEKTNSEGVKILLIVLLIILIIIVIIYGKKIKDQK